ncbi:MAG: hypothetical protein ACWGSQ_09825 [Longimicrobiales bacterium]
MNLRNLFPGLALLGVATLPGLASAQEMMPDLARIPAGEGWTVMNRAASVHEEDGRTVVSFDARLGDGGAWLEGIDFENGSIEVLVRGKNVPQRSFVGIAFRGVDDETYDAIYFRPFNFLADNALSRSHHVQYVSHPENTWSRLREDFTGVYESEIQDPPNPDGFFKARIEIEKPEIRVFVNDRTEPCLVVKELSDRTGGRVGLWMGNGSDGSFAELVLTPAGLP